MDKVNIVLLILGGVAWLYQILLFVQASAMMSSGKFKSVNVGLASGFVGTILLILGVVV